MASTFVSALRDRHSRSLVFSITATFVVQVPDSAIVYGNAPGALLCAWYIFNLFPLIEDPADRRICQIVLWAGVIMIMGIQVFTTVLVHASRRCVRGPSCSLA